MKSGDRVLDVATTVYDLFASAWDFIKEMAVELMAVLGLVVFTVSLIVLITLFVDDRHDDMCARLKPLISTNQVAQADYAKEGCK